MKILLRCLFVFCLVSSYFYAGQALSDLVEVESNRDKNQQIILIVQSVYEVTQKEFIQELTLFTDSLKNIIKNLGEYSDQSAQEFNDRCNKELQKSMIKINNISNNSVRLYYDNLDKLGMVYEIGVTDPLAQRLTIDINSIESDMINEMKAAVAILQSPDALPDLSQEIKTGVDTFQQLTQQEYATAQKQAVTVPETSWWKDLKASGTQYIGMVQVGLEKECKEQMDKATDKAIKDMKKEAIKQGNLYVKSLVKPTKKDTNQMKN